mmetsp:Transcript_20036/g.40845  ORF Transcript_20036/g.40845 Transcript_20036/m.40845 type:complete len:108 (-) Transcript_20036:121-444(-)
MQVHERSLAKPRGQPEDLFSVMYSTILELSTPSPGMFLLLGGAAYICWTNSEMLRLLRGGAGWLLWLGMAVWTACIFLAQKRAAKGKETPWQAAMSKKLEHERLHQA